MTPYTITELSVAIVGVLGAVVVIIRQVQASRCVECACCGMAKCRRELPAADDTGRGAGAAATPTTPTTF